MKNLYTMNVEYYTGVDERLDVPMILPPIPDPGFLANADVLIADDVADTGHTLAAVKEFCTGKVAEVRSAVLYEKPRSVVKCEYQWKATDLWIEFPWSDKPPDHHRQVRPPRPRRLTAVLTRFDARSWPNRGTSVARGGGRRRRRCGPTRPTRRRPGTWPRR